MNNVNFSLSINANQSSGETYTRMEKTTNKKNWAFQQNKNDKCVQHTSSDD